MSAKTFVTAVTSEIPAHPGPVANAEKYPGGTSAWEAADRLHWQARAEAEVKRTFTGKANDSTVLKWAVAVGAIGRITVRVIGHDGNIRRGAYLISERELVV